MRKETVDLGPVLLFYLSLVIRRWISVLCTVKKKTYGHNLNNRESEREREREREKERKSQG